MSKKQLTTSKALWQRRLTYRQKKVDIKRGMAKQPKGGRVVVTAEEAAAIHKWEKLRDEAKAMVARRTKQLAELEPLRERALAEGMKLVGVMEHGGNNRGEKVEQIIRYAHGQVPEAWCVDTVIWCYGRAGSAVIKPGYTRAVAYMLANGVHTTSTPAAGDPVRYLFDHTGLFRYWCNSKGKKVPKAIATHIAALEGNTGPSGAQSDSNTGGDGVYLKIRSRALVRDFLRVER